MAPWVGVSMAEGPRNEFILQRLSSFLYGWFHLVLMGKGKEVRNEISAFWSATVIDVLNPTVQCLQKSVCEVINWYRVRYHQNVDDSQLCTSSPGQISKVVEVLFQSLEVTEFSMGKNRLKFRAEILRRPNAVCSWYSYVGLFLS